MKEDFPYKGPDVSSIYYHHIPPHLAMTADYLVTEAMQRSGGNVKFPWGKQEGFVWFSNRVYGGEAGTIFDDNNVQLWLKKGLVTSSNPEVNYLTAVSDKQLWILLTNENREKETTAITLGDEAAALVNCGGAKLCTARNKTKGIAASGVTLSVDLEPKGFAAVAIPLKANAVSESAALQALLMYSGTAPLKDGCKVYETGTAAGKVYMFRIRSPFGWDSVYGFCETPPEDGVKVSVKAGDRQIEIGEYPYEWSLMKYRPDEKVEMTVEVSDGSSEFRKNIEI